MEWNIVDTWELAIVTTFFGASWEYSVVTIRYMDNVYVTESVLASGAKHKKKVYTTKKKNKHKHPKNTQ